MTTPALPPDQHRALRESLGAWVLGALDGQTRRDVATHVDSCAECAAEVAALSPLPGLLGRLSGEEATAGALLPDPGFRDRLSTSLAAAEASVQRRLVRWRALALAAVALAAGLAIALAVVPAGDGDGPGVDELDRVVAPAQPVAAAARATSGEAAALAWEWGTTVQLDLVDLPTRDAYVVWVVAEDGRREQAGTWGETSTGEARVYGASSIPRDDVARIEVTDATGELLLTFAFAGG